MTRLLQVFVFVMAAWVMIGCSKDNNTYAEISVEGYGKMKVMLYNETPKHKENFIKLASEGFYDGTLFHRVISGFMIQGGDPDSKTAASGQPLGMGGPGYTLDAEIGSPHFKGALSAARLGGNQNPEKRSSGSQFYIVQGQAVNDAILDNMERQKGIRYSPAQRDLYKQVGGTPFLDNDYTVFGEVVEGFDVIDKIAQAEKDASDRPTQDIKMEVTILN